MIRIERATPEDSDELTKLAYQAKASWGYPQHWLEAWSDILSITPLFIRDNTVLKSVDDQASIVGTVALHGERMENFWVKPNRMGQGIGRALYQAIMQEATAHGLSQVCWESDPHALAFYLHMGAQKAGERRYQLDGVMRMVPLLRRKLET